MPLFKSRAAAEEDGDVLYAPGSRDAIRGFLQAHDGYVSTDRIIEYMAEMYGTSEAITRMNLSRMTRAGELDHPIGPGLGNRPVSRGRFFAINQDAEYTGEEWV